MIRKHPTALVESEEIGPGTRIWAFVHILKGARLGTDCNVGDHSYIEYGVFIGDRVTIKNRAFLPEGVHIEDDVFVGPHVVFTNDPWPMSNNPSFQPLRTLVQRQASIGANCTILPGLTIGERAMIGAGSVVTRDVPAGMLVVGNPAKVVRPVDDRYYPEVLAARHS